ncbi:hypothetical protein ACFLUF_02625 [Chloroflexota bacterium]
MASLVLIITMRRLTIKAFEKLDKGGVVYKRKNILVLRHTQGVELSRTNRRIVC